MNRPQVMAWFEKFHSMVETLGIKDMPSHLWNIDETGCQNIHKADQVVGVMGEPTYNITALEKGETSTALVTINANACGQPSPTMVIHMEGGGGQNRTAMGSSPVRFTKNVIESESTGWK